MNIDHQSSDSDSDEAEYIPQKDSGNSEWNIEPLRCDQPAEYYSELPLPQLFSNLNIEPHPAEGILEREYYSELPELFCYLVFKEMLGKSSLLSESKYEKDVLEFAAREWLVNFSEPEDSILEFCVSQPFVRRVDVLTYSEESYRVDDYLAGPRVYSWQRTDDYVLGLIAELIPKDKLRFIENIDSDDEY